MKLPDPNEHHDEGEWRQSQQNERSIGDHYSEAWDDVSGVRLDPQKVQEARKEEIEWFRKKGVYEKIT